MRDESMAAPVAKLVTETLRSSDGPVRFTVLVTTLKGAFGADDIREAVWTLVESGKAELDSEWGVRLSGRPFRRVVTRTAPRPRHVTVTRRAPVQRTGKA